MDLKEFNQKMKDINKNFDDAVVEKIELERESTKTRASYSERIGKVTIDLSHLKRAKAELISSYYGDKRHPIEVKRLRSQFQRKRSVLMDGKELKCFYCNSETTELTAHHKVSLADGGENVTENLVWACRPCHDKEEAR